MNYFQLIKCLKNNQRTLKIYNKIVPATIALDLSVRLESSYISGHLVLMWFQETHIISYFASFRNLLFDRKLEIIFFFF